MDTKNPLNKIKFDFTINITHLGAILVYVVVGLAAFYDLKGDVRVHNEQILDIKLDLGELKTKQESNRLEITNDIRDLRMEIKKK